MCRIMIWDGSLVHSRGMADFLDLDHCTITGCKLSTVQYLIDGQGQARHIMYNT